MFARNGKNNIIIFYTNNYTSANILFILFYRFCRRRLTKKKLRSRKYNNNIIIFGSREKRIPKNVLRGLATCIRTCNTCMPNRIVAVVALRSYLK